jgi:hypothetical protein
MPNVPARVEVNETEGAPDAAGDGRADFDFLVAGPEFGDQAASTDGCASCARVSDCAGGRSDDADRLQQLQ